MNVLVLNDTFEYKPVLYTHLLC